MKKCILTLLAVLAMCTNVNAQNYVMKITMNNGETREINTNDVSNVTFVKDSLEPIVVEPYHYDLVVTVGKQGGMGRDVTTIMQSLEKLSEGSTVTYKNKGCEINATYTMETIMKGKYYYQVPVSADRFSKLQFVDNQMTVIQEQPFMGNTYKARNYTHAWLNDNTLVLMAANGEKDAIIWTKLNTDDMTIIDEGTLSISLLDGYDTFTTSGILAYRQSDNKLFYFYYNKVSGSSTMDASNEPNFHVAVINPETMAVEQDNINTDRVNEMAGSAYGQLLQQTVFFDEEDNLYLAAFNDTEIGEEGKLLRIKKGEYNFESGYNAFPNADGKLLTVQYLGNGKVFTYSRNDASGKKIDSYAHYYSVVDLNTMTRTRMAVDGSDIAYSSGRFSQRSAFARDENRVYFGVNTKSAAPCVYFYNVADGTVGKGVEIEEGYYFEQIRIMDN